MKYESNKVCDSNYFHWEDSAFHVYGERDREVIALLANRFIGHNPQAPYQYRLDFTSGITCNTKGWYQFDFGSRFPQAAVGEVCYGAGDLYSHSQTVSQFQIQCCGPTVLWVNGEKVFHSLPPQEGLKSCCTCSIPLEAGPNHFLLETEKNGDRFRPLSPPCTASMAAFPFYGAFGRKKGTGRLYLLSSH